MQFAPALWGIPVVQSSTDRTVLFPTPQVNQQVHNLQSGNIERYDGTQWVTSLPVTLNVTAFGAVGDGVTDNASAFALAAAAINAVAVGTPATLVVPDGVFYYTSGLAFTREVTLTGTGTLNYGGTGKAVKMGADGVLVANEATNRHFRVEGLTFIGGASMTHGIYFNTLVTQPRVHKCAFPNFGAANTWAIFGQSSNWDMLVTECRWTTDSNNSAINRNFCKANGVDINNVVDQGQSRLRAYHNLVTEQSNGAGIAFWLNGVNNEVAHNKIEGFSVNVHLGPYASRARVIDNYFETTKGTECIRFGDPGDGTFIQYLQVRGNYCNLHNDDAYATSASFIGAGSTTTGLQYARVRDNDITGLAADRVLIRLNNVASQNGNSASGNMGHTLLRTTDTSIDKWTDMDELLSPIHVDTDGPAWKVKAYQGGVTVNSGVTGNFVLSWDTAFTDDVYRTFLTLYDDGSASGLIHSVDAKVISWDATGVTVHIKNAGGSTFTGGFSVMGVHERPAS